MKLVNKERGQDITVHEPQPSPDAVKVRGVDIVGGFEGGHYQRRLVRRVQVLQEALSCGYRNTQTA